MYAYEQAGGRVFASHWHDFWFDAPGNPAAILDAGGTATQTANASLQSAASWTDLTPPPPDPSNGTVNTNFAKGQALHDWLQNVSALTGPGGTLPIKEPKHNASSVDADAGVLSWISLSNPNASGTTAVQYLTFNVPLGVPTANQCGRVVYSDLHVSSGDQIGPPFPTECVTTDLSPQEKALEFMLFDLSSCIQDDTKPPEPPK